jgi:hypothetical protein
MMASIGNLEQGEVRIPGRGKLAACRDRFRAYDSDEWDPQIRAGCPGGETYDSGGRTPCGEAARSDTGPHFTQENPQ